MPERVITRFSADQGTYIRAHVIMAVAATIGVAAVLAILGNAHIWVAFVAAPVAIGIRGVYLMPEEMAHVWELTDRSLTGPSGQPIMLAEVETVRSLGSAAQIITRSGNKHLMKYLADPKDVVAQIESARIA